MNVADRPPERLKTFTAEMEERLARANAEFARLRPGSRADRQPVHTVYGGAQLFRADTARKMGAVALDMLERFGDRPDAFAAALDLPARAQVADRVHERIREKLRREPVEDFRIDFEDGFGTRSDQEEDEEADRTAAELATALQEGLLPPHSGIRIKSLSDETAQRGLRTLDRFVRGVVSAAGRLPDRFVVTLPKITGPEHPAALAERLQALEADVGLVSGAIGIELMIETPTSIFDTAGRVALPLLVEACDGRCTAAHFGVYDYTAGLDITAAHQAMRHPACDFARDVMQVALAGTGVWVSDGATNIMPVPPHRGEDLTAEQRDENRAVVHRAWRLAATDTLHGLRRGIYQGWDLHPAQLPARYAAVFSFFLDGLEAAAHRLRTFVDRAARATLVGDVFDDAATGQGLLNYFLRAEACGAITASEAAGCGLTRAELETRSFARIMAGRSRSFESPGEGPEPE